MSKVEKFEDLVCWQSARELTKNIYHLTNATSFAKDYSLRDQIRRSAISISSNIAEGFERGGNKEFVQFLFISKASCAELRSQLYLSLDCNYISQIEFEKQLTIAIKTSKMIYGLINYLKSSELKGKKFMEDPIDYVNLNGERNTEN